MVLFHDVAFNENRVSVIEVVHDTIERKYYARIKFLPGTLDKVNHIDFPFDFSCQAKSAVEEITILINARQSTLARQGIL